MIDTNLMCPVAWEYLPAVRWVMGSETYSPAGAGGTQSYPYRCRFHSDAPAHRCHYLKWMEWNTLLYLNFPV